MEERGWCIGTGCCCSEQHLALLPVPTSGGDSGCWEWGSLVQGVGTQCRGQQLLDLHCGGKHLSSRWVKKRSGAPTCIEVIFPHLLEVTTDIFETAVPTDKLALCHHLRIVSEWMRNPGALKES